METNDILGLIGMICGITAAVLLVGAFISLILSSSGGTILGLTTLAQGGTDLALLFIALLVSIPGLVLSIIGVAMDSVERTKFGIAGIIISGSVLGILVFMMMFFVG